MNLKSVALVSLLVFAPLFAPAQTFVRIGLTNFTLNGGVITATTNISVGQGMLVHINSVQYSPNVSGEDEFGNTFKYLGVTVGVQYPGGPWVYPNQDDFQIGIEGHPILGPCTLRITATATDKVNAAAYVLLRYETVNVAPLPTGVVQPPNQPVKVSLQSSMNLTTWETATNGNYGPTNGFRFFRVLLQQ